MNKIDLTQTMFKVKDVLEEMSKNSEMKTELIVGKKVQLAEEMKKVREIQNKLELFIQALKKEP